MNYHFTDNQDHKSNNNSDSITINNQHDNHQKFIFVSGGVISSLGKGVVAASIGALLQTRSLRVTITKADPYLNMDPGTMNPLQHGEVFVTDDGAETDLDLGHYERFIGHKLTKKNSFTTGQVYDAVLNRERQGGYLGRTVQVVPDITNQIKHNIYHASSGADVSIVEIGGTVGDIESLPFLETIRQLRWELGSECVLFCHVTLVPYVHVAGELKSKPTQHSVRDLRQLGIQPDLLICRCDRLLKDDLKNKIALFCNVDRKKVFESLDQDSIYKVPLMFHRQGLDSAIVKQFNIWTKQPDLKPWIKIENCLDKPKDHIKIAIVGKYTPVVDSYKSIIESLVHGGISANVKVNGEFVDAQKLNQENYINKLDRFHGCVIPGGFGDRAVDGKILASKYFRTKLKPLLGICLGMQITLIEIARNVLQLKKASSEEFDPKAEDLIIYLMEDQRKHLSKSNKGGTMRLGAYPCILQPDSLMHSIYQKDHITERHRHRYEFNNKYRSLFTQHGVKFCGLSPDHQLVEAIELTNHPFFIGCQFHPEFNSTPMKAHPLFEALVNHALNYKTPDLPTLPTRIKKKA